MIYKEDSKKILQSVSLLLAETDEAQGGHLLKLKAPLPKEIREIFSPINGDRPLLGASLKSWPGTSRVIR